MPKKKILLIEDDDSMVKILEFRLKKNGFNVVVALDGEEGMEKVKKNKLDLVILDLMLPKLPGEEVCRRMRKDRETADIPVIMLTAKALDVDRIVGKVIGADYYITKPFDPEDLLKKINKLIDGKKNSK